MIGPTREPRSSDKLGDLVTMTEPEPFFHKEEVSHKGKKWTMVYVLAAVGFLLLTVVLIYAGYLAYPYGVRETRPLYAVLLVFAVFSFVGFVVMVDFVVHPRDRDE